MLISEVPLYPLSGDQVVFDPHQIVKMLGTGLSRSVTPYPLLDEHSLQRRRPG